MLVWVFGLIGTAALACSSTIDFLFHVLHLRGRAYDGTSQERSSLQGEAHSFCVLHLHQHHAGAVSLCIFVCSCLCYFRLLFLCLSYQLKASLALRSGLSISRIMPLPSWLVSSSSFCSFMLSKLTITGTSPSCVSKSRTKLTSSFHFIKFSRLSSVAVISCSVKSTVRSQICCFSLFHSSFAVASCRCGFFV